MTVAMAFLLVAAQAPDPVVMNYDPPAAQGWEQTVTFRCGGTTLRVTGYGASRPIGRVASLVVNGAVLEGAAVKALRRDLVNPAAVYRLGARCPRDRNSISLLIARGEKLKSGEVDYRSGSALIRGTRLQSYTGLRQVDAETFWFR